MERDELPKGQNCIWFRRRHGSLCRPGLLRRMLSRGVAPVLVAVSMNEHPLAIETFVFPHCERSSGHIRRLPCDDSFCHPAPVCLLLFSASPPVP